MTLGTYRHLKRNEYEMSGVARSSENSVKERLV